MDEMKESDDGKRRGFDNDVLEQTSIMLHDELQKRIREAAKDGPDAVKSTILDILKDTAGISEDDWGRLLHGNLYAIEKEKEYGVSFEASVNACMYTNFLLGYFMAKALSGLDSENIPEDWLK